MTKIMWRNTVSACVVLLIGLLLVHCAEGASEKTLLQQQLFKLEVLRNRRFSDPKSADTVPPALNIEVLKQMRQESLANDFSGMLEKSRIKSSAMDRLREKMADIHNKLQDSSSERA